MSQANAPRSFWDAARVLPVAFVLVNIVSLYIIYSLFHLMPLLLNSETFKEGEVQALIFNIVSFLMMLSYIRAVVTNPGNIPDETSAWEYAPGGAAQPETKEVKATGERRHCKWCAKYKPDRCHHCRVCRTCILKMDHHCPWIYNCVGFRNHKYFFLLLLYSAIACNWITFTMIPTVEDAVNRNDNFGSMFLVLFAETLAAFLGLLITLFFVFHIWLMLKGMTTIEFCEKSTKNQGFNNSAYDRGINGNLRAVLGDWMILWFLPVSPPSGNGTDFGPDAFLERELETDRGVRRKSGKARSYGSTSKESRMLSGWSKQQSSRKEQQACPFTDDSEDITLFQTHEMPRRLP
eukprot:TRINITY_DN4046_c0_g1_i1.p1 TRINITY_DN4046_c0_g1~~TRINITY_DN4046_c0_g1_i1.p1  ORF type:complete len:390 (+),score=53.21 TRINITY_DN4046_c0_g1_i1:126-1172(+)